MTRQLSEQQQLAADTILGMRHAPSRLAVQAGPGSGKTTLVEHTTKIARDTEFVYIVYTAAMKEEARKRMPSNVKVMTGHGLSYPFAMKRFSDLEARTNRRWSPRSIKDFFEADIQPIRHGTIYLSHWQQIRWIQNALNKYMFSDGQTLRSGMIVSTMPKDLYLAHKEGKLDEGVLKSLCESIGKHCLTLWKEMTQINSELPLPHDAYLKVWCQSNPTIGRPGAIIIMDEFQDSNPAILGAVKQQVDRSTAGIGDPYQSIFAWRGASNAFGEWECDSTQYLTQSYRYGQELADVANTIIRPLNPPNEFVLRGLGRTTDIYTTHKHHTYENTHAILTRTNAELAAQLMGHYARTGQAGHVVGGVSEIKELVYGVEALRSQQQPRHRELADFKSYQELVEYTASSQDPEMRKLVELTETYSTEKLLQVFAQAEKTGISAPLCLSTAHRAKGLEFPHVTIGSDFKEPAELSSNNRDDIQERLLQYVACTRAMHSLDVSQAPGMATYLHNGGTTEKKSDPQPSAPVPDSPPIHFIVDPVDIESPHPDTTSPSTSEPTVSLTLDSPIPASLFETEAMTSFARSLVPLQRFIYATDIHAAIVMPLDTQDGADNQSTCVLKNDQGFKIVKQHDWEQSHFATARLLLAMASHEDRATARIHDIGNAVHVIMRMYSEFLNGDLDNKIQRRTRANNMLNLINEATPLPHDRRPLVFFPNCNTVLTHGQVENMVMSYFGVAQELSTVTMPHSEVATLIAAYQHNNEQPIPRDYTHFVSDPSIGNLTRSVIAAHTTVQPELEQLTIILMDMQPKTELESPPILHKPTGLTMDDLKQFTTMHSWLRIQSIYPEMDKKTFQIYYDRTRQVEHFLSAVERRGLFPAATKIKQGCEAILGKLSLLDQYTSTTYRNSIGLNIDESTLRSHGPG